MFYYTQLIYTLKGMEAQLNDFEARVTPLLEKHNGKLQYLVKPDKTTVVATAIGYPDELHLISFLTREDFHNYLRDEERQKILGEKNMAVEKVVVIEGAEVKI